MSGHKRATVSISQEEYDRLHEAEIRMRSLPDFSPAVHHSINQQSAEALNQTFSDTQRRLDMYEQLVARMSDQILSLESSASQRLYDVQVNMTAEAQRHAGELWDHFERLLNENNLRYQETIEANHRLVDDQMAAMAEQYQEINSSVEAQRAAAANWITDTKQLFTFLRDTYDCDQFAQGKLARLEARFNQAYQNYLAGFFETSLSVSQQVYMELSDLHINLERVVSEWQVLRLSVLETLNYLIEQAINSQRVEAFDLDGNPLSVTVDVDDWMDGRLRKWIDALTLFKKEIEEGKIFLDSETLQRLLVVDFPANFQELQEMVLNARVMALNSQLRINIADLVIRALQDQGFKFNPQDAQYESNNASCSYNARLYNREGNEVFVNVVPGENGFGENELHLQSQDAEEHTEHELFQRWKEVSRSLRYYGLQVGQVEQVQENGGQRGSIAQRLRNAARKLRTSVSTGKPEEGNEYRTDP